MATVAQDHDVERRALVEAAIHRAIENLLDLDIVVDDRRREREDAERVEAEAIMARDAEANRLEHLIASSSQP